MLLTPSRMPGHQVIGAYVFQCAACLCSVTRGGTQARLAKACTAHAARHAEPDCFNDDDADDSTASVAPVQVPWRVKLAAGYPKDPWFAIPAHTADLQSEEGLWYTAAGKLVIPAADALRGQVLQEVHDSPYSGHLDTNKTFKLVTRHYWWPGVTAQVPQSL